MKGKDAIASRHLGWHLDLLAGTTFEVAFAITTCPIRMRVQSR